MAIRKNIAGKRFNRLVAIEPSHSIGYRHYWKCLCDCGKFTNVCISKLGSGSTKSCGCLNDEKRKKNNYKHGMFGTKVYNTWSRMIGRCENSRNPKYQEYGARGIQVCKEWRDSFDLFYLHVGDPPSDKHQIDRIDTNGDYEPGNVRWVDLHEQAQNKRNSKWWICGGVRYESCYQAAEALGLDHVTIFKRCKSGWNDWYSESKYGVQP